MWGMTERAKASLARSGDQSARIEVLHDGEVSARLGSVPVKDRLSGEFIPSIGGNVSCSRQAIRRDGVVSFLDLSGDLAPTEIGDLFQPLVSEIRPYIGIHYWDATALEIRNEQHIEWIPLATLVVQEYDSASWPEVTVSGQDRLSFLTPFVRGYSIFDATPNDTAIHEIFELKVPASHLRINLPQTEFTTGALLYEENTASLDRVHELALAAGWALSANPLGEIRAITEPTTEDEPLIIYEPGPKSMLLRPQRNISARDIVNVVVFTSEDLVSTAIRGEARDDDPTSLTYWQRVGEYPKFESSPLMRSTAQCELAARTMLNRLLGLADNIAVPVVPNPALDAGDVIWVSDGEAINFPLIVDSFTTYLRASDGDQVIKTRSRVITNE